MPRIRSAGDAGMPEVPPTGDRPRPGAAQVAAFGRELQAARAGRLRDHLDQILREIDGLGARLAGELTITNLKNYREAVRTFLQELQREAVAVQTELEWDYQSWQHRSLTVVRKVDEELEELGRMVLDHEEDRLKILAKLGEIKGMLLDIRI